MFSRTATVAYRMATRYPSVTRVHTRSMASMDSYIKDRTPKSDSLLSKIQDSGAVGVQRYITRVAQSTGQSLMTAGAVAGSIATMYHFGLPKELVLTGFGVGFVGGITSIIKMGTDTVHVEEDEIGPYVVSSPSRKWWFNAFGVSEGLTIAPIICMFPAAAIPAALGTAGIVGGTAAAATLLPRGSTNWMGPPLFGCLLGMVGVGFANIFIGSPLLHSLDVYGGIGLFGLYTVYDTHQTIEDYEKGNLDHLNHSMNFTLNFINIFVRLIQIMGGKTSD